MALDKLVAPEFRRSLKGVSNPYGDGGAAQGIMDVISKVDLSGLINKGFYDVA